MRKNCKVCHGVKVVENYHFVCRVLFQLPHNWFFTFSSKLKLKYLNLERNEKPKFALFSSY